MSLDVQSTAQQSSSSANALHGLQLIILWKHVLQMPTDEDKTADLTLPVRACGGRETWWYPAL